MKKYLILASFFFLSCIIAPCVNCQWQQTFWPKDVHCFGNLGSKILAASFNTIIVSYDSGLTWSTVWDQHSVSNMIYAIVSKDSFLFAGCDSGIFKSEDKGNTWIKVGNQSITSNVLSLLAKDNTIIAGSYGGIFRSIDNGLNWSVIDVHGVLFENFVVHYNYIFSSTYTTGVFRSSDNGYHWGKVLSDTICGDCYTAVSGNNIFTIGRDTVYISSDNGTSWRPTSSIFSTAGFSGASSAIVAIGSNIFVGANDADGGVVLSTNEGQSWKKIGSMHRVNSLFISGDYIFAGTNNTGVYRARLSDFGVDAVSASSTKNISKFSILSNPITTSAGFQFDALKESSNFELFDLLGRSVLRQQLSAGQSSLHLEMLKYPAGIYFARLGGETVRFIKY